MTDGLAPRRNGSISNIEKSLAMEKKNSIKGNLFFSLANIWFSSIRYGQLQLVLPDGSTRLFQGKEAGPIVVLEIFSPKVLTYCLKRGAIGFAEAYLDGLWESDDLSQLFALFLKNRRSLSVKPALFKRISQADHYRHRASENTRDGSRRNIAAHYDLGNDFYALWLDPTMTYSSALFDGERRSLEEAQTAKYEKVLEMLKLKDGESVLEIGCGWGGFAEHLSHSRDTSYLGITLSEEQLAFAGERMARRSDQQYKFALTDYRDITKTYNNIVSIEMMEAVGEKYWPQYFEKISDTLNPGGAAVLQVITIDENAFASYRAKPDFIQRYIFPGGMLPTVSHMHSGSSEAGLICEEPYLFGPDYALTLRKWRVRFIKNWDAIQELGFDQRFFRMWIYYLDYCIAGFEDGVLQVGLYRMTKNESLSHQEQSKPHAKPYR